MKTIYLLVVLLSAATIAKAQLKNTKWEGKLNLPDEVTVDLDFKSDTVEMLIVEQGYVGETMTYSAGDSVLTMAKVSGNSPCNVGDVFKVKYFIKGDKLFIGSLSDPCAARTQAWTSEPLIRIKQ